jgi:hypothetical protein
MAAGKYKVSVNKYGKDKEDDTNMTLTTFGSSKEVMIL